MNTVQRLMVSDYKLPYCYTSLAPYMIQYPGVIKNTIKHSTAVEPFTQLFTLN